MGDQQELFSAIKEGADAVSKSSSDIVEENALEPLNHLTRDKHPQQELFICDVADAVLKDIMQQMEHPFYSLSKTPVNKIREYRNGDNWIRIAPSAYGLATIYDKDILIYAISQLMAAKARGEEISPRVRINTHEFLIFSNRGTGGSEYKNFVKALERLRGTTITTNVRTGDEEQTDIFGLIDTSSIRRKNGLDGRLLWVEVVLSKWVFNAIQSNEVLSMSRDYFRLSKPYERRVYEIARKHCGKKEEWVIGQEKLRNKMGATSTMYKFRFFIKELIERDTLPEYSVQLDGENVVFRNREKSLPTKPVRIFIKEQTKENAKKHTIPVGGDVHAWFEDWVEWWNNQGCPELKSPDGAFIGFCKKRAETMPKRH